jgi:AcrR family transcriptional regulator
VLQIWKSKHEDEMPAADTRQQIVDAADQLFYETGFEATSFADIAAAVKLSRGNFYYHFKTKDEILAAVIKQRLANTRAMLDRWQAEGRSPGEAIRDFIRMLAVNGDKIMAYGCPVGTLCNELSKLDHAAKPQAVAIFLMFREWLAQQFQKLGYNGDCDVPAMHLLMRSQGVATLATAFADEDFIRREMDDMFCWLDAQVPSAAPISKPE